jgi:hypothetical protein
MPAHERLFSDPPPTDHYLDTDFVIAYLIDTGPTISDVATSSGA